MLTYRRRNALAFCSSLAIAAALAAAPQAGLAQSFQGNSTVVAGSATVTTGSATTTVDVASPQAVINWTPFDTATNPGAPINFQPAGTTATFQGTSQFAVLNRILPADASRPVMFNGTVISQLQGAATTPGGTVYFYSPGGILVGASAVFNVGNLGLTALDPVLDGNGNWYNGNQVQFQQGNPGSIVNIQPGAQLTASRANSYIALVAPSVQNNGGTITVNGSAALVAAEAATVTFSPDGLFTIQVGVGTSAETYAGTSGNVALANTGTITGPAGTAGTDNHRIYLVAVPKNQLMASLVMGNGSKVGFDVAAAADTSGNAVVLSAGHDIVAGQISAPPSPGAGSGTAIIDSFNAAYTSDVVARATGRALFASDGSTGTGTTSFAAGLSVHSATTASLEARSRGTASVAGNLALNTDAFALGPGQSATGGNTYISANDGAAITVGGSALVSAVAQGGRATGGTAGAYLDNGGSISVGGALRLRADGFSAVDASALGGTSAASVGNGSTLTVNQLNVTADGVVGQSGATAAPGSGTGGSALINVFGNGSTLSVQAGIPSASTVRELSLLSAQGFGGASNAAGTAGGSAQGGTASLNVSSGAVVNLPVDPGPSGFIRMFARAYGGNTFATGGTGGSATGGNVSVNVNGATLNAGNTLLPSSFALGGSADASVSGAANGGNAVGGVRNVTVINGTVRGSFAGGGPGAQGGDGSPLGTGGNGTGGTANFFMDNGAITATTDAFGIGRVTAFTQNAGGTGAIGGSASGGVTNVTIRNNSVITLNADSNGTGGIVAFSASNTTPGLGSAGAIASGDAAGGTVNVTISNSRIDAANFAVAADARSGGIATTGGAGAAARTGNATGGTANLDLDGATITAGFMNVTALGDAGDAEDTATVNAGIGTGGAARIVARGAASTITAGGLNVDASGSGGTVFGGPGNGGSAVGGRALVQANSGGKLTVSGPSVILAGARGGSAQVQGRGGDASSGFAEVSAVGGGSLAFTGDLEVTAEADGGGGAVAGSASAQTQNVTSGLLPNALLYAANGSIAVSGTALLAAPSFGGAGLAGGKGGNAKAGFAVVNSDNNLAGPSTISLRDLFVSASSYGGDGGTGLSGSVGGAGGDATGGEADAFAGAGNGSLTVAGQTNILATALGGSGGAGGSGGSGGAGGAGGAATAGLALFGTLSRADTGATNTGAASFAAVAAIADAFGGAGGAGGTGASSTGNGGAGGAANGGAAILVVRGSRTTVSGGAALFGNATGGAGGSGAVQGAGGAATVGGAGGVAVTVTNRFQQPTQRGFLNAQDIFGSAEARGGAGSVEGAAIVGDSPISLEVSGGTLSAAALTLAASGVPAAEARLSFISIANGTVDIAGALSMSTPGTMSVSLDNSPVNVGSLALAAGNFVLPALRPATFGTFNVRGALNLESNLDFVAYANFVLSGGATFATEGTILTGDITANGPVNLQAAGTLTTGAVTAPDVVLAGGQGVTTNAITASGTINVASAKAVSLGALTAGGTTPGRGKIAVSSTSGPVTAGAIRSTGDLGIQTGGSITTGNLIGRDVLVLAGGSVTTGSILAASGTQTTGAIYFGNYSMAGSTANVFQPFRGQGGMLSIFQAAPVAIGGSATFGGQIQGGTLKGAAQGAVTAQAIDAASFIQLEAGGLASINGAWRSPDISLASGDIAIAPTGSLDALSVNGSIDLASTNAAGMTVGDGVGGTAGYVLDNAEFGRLKAGHIQIVGIDSSQATDMTIGDLTITGGQLYGDGGTLLFATGTRQTQTPGGILRIAGAVNASGFAAGNEISLLAGTVELEAVKGSLRVTNASGGLGGLLYIAADRIHVASDTVLAKLRADPLYAGHITDLNTPLAVARPEGVLSASGFHLYPGETLYVQNTGTAATPAGFLVDADNVDITPPHEPPTGGIEVVVNGQLQSGQSRLTGRAAFDRAVSGAATDSTAFAGFSKTSQLNGCLFLGGTCSTGASDPIASVASAITVVTSATLDDSPRAPTADDADEGSDGSSDDQDEDSDGDTGAAPIVPPVPLINTRALSRNADIEQPVAGAGNPALLGTVVPEGAPQGEKK